MIAPGIAVSEWAAELLKENGGKILGFNANIKNDEAKSIGSHGKNIKGEDDIPGLLIMMETRRQGDALGFGAGQRPKNESLGLATIIERSGSIDNRPIDNEKAKIRESVDVRSGSLMPDIASKIDLKCPKSRKCDQNVARR